MRIFITGATGFIGSALIPELIQSGHQVLGLTRSEDGAKALRTTGAEPHYGNLDDLDSIRSGAEQADAVIHLGFNHDFSKFAANCEQDRRVIETIGQVLLGSARPLLVTSGAAISYSTDGTPPTEDGPILSAAQFPRAATEEATNALTEKGINTTIVRLPQVHDMQKQGLISYLIPIAKQQGFVAYVGEGKNNWAAAHISDVARLYHLALDKNQPGARYHAVAEAVPSKAVAETVAQGLNLPARSLTPEEAPSFFGWMAHLAQMDMSASSKLTREQLNWNPTGPDLLTDLKNMDYSAL